MEETRETPGSRAAPQQSRYCVYLTVQVDGGLVGYIIDASPLLV
jgi:hypothetical protein